MYDNPRPIRQHEIKIRVNADEYDFLRAWARLARKQLAVLARERLLAGVELLTQEQQQEFAEKRSA